MKSAAFYEFGVGDLARVMRNSLTVSVLFSLSVFGAVSEAGAVTYNLGSGFDLGIIAGGPGGNPPETPNNLICIAAADTCNIKVGPSLVQAGTYTGADDINSAALWKSGVASTSFSFTSSGTSGTWTQTWQGTLGEVLTHYVAAKTANAYHLIGYDLSLITAALNVGDMITGSWTTNIFNSNNEEQTLSHLMLYNSAPAVVPIPAALPLFGGALGLLGLLGWRRNRVAA